MNRVSLKWKITTYMMGFSLLLLAILWLMQVVFLEDMYIIVRENEMNQAVQLIEENINSPNLQTIIYELEEDRDILVTRTENFMKIDYKSSRYFISGERLESMPPPNEGKEQRFMTLDYVFGLEDGKTIELTFHGMLTPVDATISTLMLQLYIVTVLMVGLSVVIAIFIGKRIAKPIETLNEGAKYLISDSEQIKFEAKGFVEIEELSDTLNQTAKELSKVEALRRELVANISHDLKTPIALIYSYAEMMYDFPEEIEQEQLQVIMDESKRLTSLVTDALDISKIETGHLTLTKQTYNLTNSLIDTIERIKVLVQKEGYHISFNPEESLEVYADEIKINQVFYNLLINAITHSGRDKQIIVTQQREKTYVKVSIIDYGEGIKEEDLEFIWERYYKVNKTHKRSITGTGLGLSIVNKIIKLHEGECGVHSKEGEGSTFWFKLEIDKDTL